MDRAAGRFGIALAFLAIASTVLGAVSWSRIPKFHLPLPSWIAGLSTLLPVVSILLLAALQILLNRYTPSTRSNLKYYISALSTVPLYILASVLLGLGSEYVSSSGILHCRMESQWMRFFRSHNEEAIRGIQIALQCCGYNSIRDRAWPFPGHGVGVEECARSLGFQRPCAGIWMQEQRATGGYVTASNTVSLVSLVMISILLARHQLRSRTWEPHQNRDAVGRLTDADEPALQRIEHYTDDPEDQQNVHEQRDAVDEDDDADSGFGGNPSLHISGLR